MERRVLLSSLTVDDTFMLELESEIFEQFGNGRRCTTVYLPELEMKITELGIALR